MWNKVSFIEKKNTIISHKQCFTDKKILWSTFPLATFYQANDVMWFPWRISVMMVMFFSNLAEDQQYFPYHIININQWFRYLMKGLLSLFHHSCLYNCCCSWWTSAGNADEWFLPLWLHGTLILSNGYFPFLLPQPSGTNHRGKNHAWAKLAIIQLRAATKQTKTKKCLLVQPLCIRHA